MGRSLLNDQFDETVSLAFNRFVGSGLREYLRGWSIY